MLYVNVETNPTNNRIAKPELFIKTYTLTQRDVYRVGGLPSPYYLVRADTRSAPTYCVA